MISVIAGVFTRIISNSYLNVFQKLLTSKGARSSEVNFFTYLGLTVAGLCLYNYFYIPTTFDLILNTAIMGLLGALGNYFIIKALSLGELSSLAPINSYKPIVALIIGFFYLKEIPDIFAVVGILLIIFGTIILHGRNGILNKKAVFYRVLALVFSGSEAVFIKKVILLTNIPSSFFLWAVSGLIFSLFFIVPYRFKIKLPDIKYQILLILSVGIMQYSTNFVFSKINVSYALALFQLSTLFSVILGAGIFHEKNIKQKITASLIMILGAVLLILV